MENLFATQCTLETGSKRRSHLIHLLSKVKQHSTILFHLKFRQESVTEGAKISESCGGKMKKYNVKGQTKSKGKTPIICFLFTNHPIIVTMRK